MIGTGVAEDREMFTQLIWNYLKLAIRLNRKQHCHKSVDVEM